MSFSFNEPLSIPNGTASLDMQSMYSNTSLLRFMYLLLIVIFEPPVIFIVLINTILNKIQRSNASFGYLQTIALINVYLEISFLRLLDQTQCVQMLGYHELGAMQLMKLELYYLQYLLLI